MLILDKTTFDRIYPFPVDEQPCIDSGLAGVGCSVEFVVENLGHF